MRKHWTWLIGLVAAELIVAMLLSRVDLPASVTGMAPIRWLSAVAPVIANFDSLPNVSKAVPLYLAITVLLLPLKVLFWSLWLRSGSLNLITFVPSPMRAPSTSAADFVLDKPVPTVRTGFSFRGFVVSLFFMLICGLITMAYLNWGWDLAEGKSPGLPSIQSSYEHISQGGFALWLSWGYRVMVVAFLIACFLQTFLEFFTLFGFRARKAS